MRRSTAGVGPLVPVLLAAVLLALAGCSSEDAPDASASSTKQAPTPSAAPPPAAPTVGSCHDLSFEAAAQPTDGKAAVPCRGSHSSVTIFVGRLAPLSDGHLLTVDSKKVQDQVASACPKKLAGYVGGDETARRLSRFKVVWFSPTVKQSDAGANWFRCDVVALRGQDRLAELPPRAKGVLDPDNALDHFGTCGTAAPDKKNFVRLICSEKHRWQAIDTVEIANGSYLGKPAQRAADAHCKDVASNRSAGALKYTWSFEWPTREQWDAGQRYGYCWVPTS